MDPSLDATAQWLQRLLLYGVLPVWILAGFGDWLIHRSLRIEHTAGWPESALHLLLVAEMGVAAMAVLLLELTSAVFVVLFVACLLHEVTVWADLSYAMKRRRIPVIEQWVHSIQIVLPWVGLVLLAVIHRHEAAAAIGLRDAADWSLRMKEPSLRTSQITAAIVAALLLVVAPFVQEFARCLRTRRVRKAAPIRVSGTIEPPPQRRTVTTA